MNGNSGALMHPISKMLAECMKIFDYWVLWNFRYLLNIKEAIIKTLLKYEVCISVYSVSVLIEVY